MNTKQHAIKKVTSRVGQSTYYNIPFYTTGLECSCGWSKRLANIDPVHERDEAITEHKVDLIAENLGLTFSYDL